MFYKVKKNSRDVEFLQYPQDQRSASSYENNSQEKSDEQEQNQSFSQQMSGSKEASQQRNKSELSNYQEQLSSYEENIQYKHNEISVDSEAPRKRVSKRQRNAYPQKFLKKEQKRNKYPKEFQQSQADPQEKNTKKIINQTDLANPLIQTSETCFSSRNLQICVYLSISILLIVYHFFVVNEGKSQKDSLQFYTNFCLFAMIGIGIGGVSGFKTQWTSVCYISFLIFMGVMWYMPLSRLVGISYLSNKADLNSGFFSGLVLGLGNFLLLSPIIDRVKLVTVLVIFVINSLGYCFVQQLQQLLKVDDPAGIFKVHIYCCVASIVLSSAFRKRIARTSNNNEVLQDSDKTLFSLLGSSFNVILLPMIIAGGYSQGIIIINITLSQIGSTISAFIVNILFKPALEPQSVLVASLTGGLIIAVSAPHLVQTSIALMIGVAGGMVSSFICNSSLYSHLNIINTVQTKIDKSVVMQDILNDVIKREKYYDPVGHVLYHVVPALMSIVTGLLVLTTFTPQIASTNLIFEYQMKIVLMTISTVMMALLSGFVCSTVSFLFEQS